MKLPLRVETSIMLNSLAFLNMERKMISEQFKNEDCLYYIFITSFAFHSAMSNALHNFL